MPNLYVFLLYIFILISLFSCKENESNNNGTINKSLQKTNEVDSIYLTNGSLDTKNNISNNQKVNYNLIHLNSDSALQYFQQKFSENQKRIISDLNRIDLYRISVGDSIIIPQLFYDSLFFYSPFPFYMDQLIDVNKILYISRKIQAFAAYENGKLVRWGPTSLGKKSSPTPAGLYFTNWKSKTTISTVNEDWVMNWYFNIENYRGISIHEYAMPGYPASHACVRLKKEDATWFYNWAEQWKLSTDGQEILAYGTPVILYDSYDFDKPAPWELLADDPDVTKQSAEKVNEVYQPHADLILKRQMERIIFLQKEQSL